MTTTPVDLKRIELNWLYRQLMSGRDKAAAIVQSYTGPLTEDRTAELNQAQKHFDEIDALTKSIKDRLDAGDKERLQINDMRDELNEALELAPASTAVINERLAALPKEIPYRVAFDRDTLKFTLKLVEKDLEKFRAHVIPNYQKAEESDFKDPIQTKEFWVNKALKSKDVLDQLRVKLEKAL